MIANCFFCFCDFHLDQIFFSEERYAIAHLRRTTSSNNRKKTTSNRKKKVSRKYFCARHKKPVCSWLYVLVELFTGELPWAPHKRREKEAVRAQKERTRSAEGAEKLFRYCPRVSRLIIAFFLHYNPIIKIYSYRQNFGE